jgi:hypothetical protein
MLEHTVMLWGTQDNIHMYWVQTNSDTTPMSASPGIVVVITISSGGEVQSTRGDVSWIDHEIGKYPTVLPKVIDVADGKFGNCLDTRDHFLESMESQIHLPLVVFGRGFNSLESWFKVSGSDLNGCFLGDHIGQSDRVVLMFDISFN